MRKTKRGWRELRISLMSGEEYAKNSGCYTICIIYSSFYWLWMFKLNYSWIAIKKFNNVIDIQIELDLNLLIENYKYITCYAFYYFLVIIIWGFLSLIIYHLIIMLYYDSTLEKSSQKSSKYSFVIPLCCIKVKFFDNF